VVALGACAWPYTVDDAFIVALYAKRLAAGLGYTLSGTAPTDGVTGPLWLVPGLIAAQLDLEPTWAAKLVGLGCAALAVGLILRRRLARAGGGQAAWFALLLVACQPSLGSWGIAGLETGAATLALCVAVLAATRRPVAAQRTAACALAVLPWLRPELIVAALVVLLMLFVRRGARALPALVFVLASWAALLAFRYALFGALVPLAFHAKLGSALDGCSYTLRACFVLFGGLGLGLCAAACVRGRGDDRWAAAVVIAHGCAVTLAGGDWMPGFRLYVPIMPLYIGLAAVGAQSLMRTRWGMSFAVLALIFACGIPFADLVTRVPELRSSGESRERVGRALIARLRAHRTTRVALVDIGYVGYASGLPLVDLAGITDPEIARMPGGHLAKRIPAAWLRARAPDAIVLHATQPPDVDAHGQLLHLHGGYPVEQLVARDPWVKEHFRVAQVFRYARGYEYVLLVAHHAL
jgi:hypothetical protein